MEAVVSSYVIQKAKEGVDVEMLLRPKAKKEDETTLTAHHLKPQNRFKIFDH